MLFKEIIAAYNENRMKSMSTKSELLIVKAGGTYSYNWALMA
jgi:hypothetical protein